MLRRAWFLLHRAFAGYSAVAGGRDAAQVAFYVLLSFPSILLLLVWGVAGLLDDPTVRDDVVDAIVGVLPVADSARTELEQLLDGIVAGASGVGWIGGLSLAYSASGAVGALRHALDDAWGVRSGRPYLRGKALDLGLVFALGPVLIAATALGLAGWVPRLLDSRPFLASGWTLLLGVVLPVVLVLLLLAALFRFLPAAHVTWRAAFAGAAVGVVGLIVVQVALTIYASVSSGSGPVSGAIGALLAVCVAVQAQTNAVVIGAHMSAAVGRLPDAAAIDAAAAEAAAGPPDERSLARRALDAVRGLVVRA